MPKLLRDPQRRTEIEAKGGVIYSSAAGWPLPAASFEPDAQQRILHKTGSPLRVPPNKQPRMWQNLEQVCRLFAFDTQLDNEQGPSASQIRMARAAAERLKAAMPPMLGHHPTDAAAVVYSTLIKLVQQWDAEYKRRPSRPKHTAARTFIYDMGCMFAAAFERVPSAAPDGPFARFVLACLDETQGLPETLSGNWVQKYVREYKAASQGNGNLWALSERLAWDDTP